MTSHLGAKAETPPGQDRARPAHAPAGPRRARGSVYDRFLEALEDLLRERERGRRRSGDRRVLGRGHPDRRDRDHPRARLQPASEQVGPYAATVASLTGLLMAVLAFANYQLAPMTYSPRQHAEVAEALVAGTNYAVFDLNLDTRGLRRAHLERLPTRPEVMVYGASHWQEAHADLLPSLDFYNAHVHRDYHEDILAVVEMLIRYDRLPGTLILSIRDMTFASIADRSDFLWLTGTTDYRSMTSRLGLEAPDWFEILPERHYLGLFSLGTLVDNARRIWVAPVQPGPVRAASLPTLDVLQTDGSIRWSDQHQAAFTAERRQREVDAAVRVRGDRAPGIDPAAVEAIDRLIGLLTKRGVEVVLIHPPFNPEFYQMVAETPYGQGLQVVEDLTRRLADAHDARVVGSFDPAVAGCRAEMYIDSEHANPDCLGRVLAQVPGLTGHRRLGALATGSVAGS